MSLLPTLGISFLLCGIIPNFSSSYNVTITNVKDATSYRHGVRPIEKTLSRTTNGISEISFAFLNIIPVGKIIEDINVSISFENVSRIDFEKSFSQHVVNHKTNMVLTDLTERIHIYLNSSEQYLLINDLCELKCSNMTYCLTLNLTCRIQSEDMDTSAMSAILSTSWTEPFCDFDNQCFLEYEGQFYMSDNGTEGRCNICMTLPRTEHISGRYAHTMKNESNNSMAWMKSKIIYGSSYGCELKLSEWQYTKAVLIVTITTINRFRVIKTLLREHYKRYWNQTRISIGRIPEPFYLSIGFRSEYLVAVDDIVLSNCETDIPPKVCTKTEYQCHSGQCINNHRKCDMIQDCFHGDDEAKELCNGIASDFTRCDFDHGLCGWKIQNHSHSCRWEKVQISNIIISHLKFTFQPRGEILFINGSKCNEKGHVDVDVDMKSPIFLSDGHGICKMNFSYIMNFGILRVDLCEIRSNDTEDCSKRIGVFNIERQWLSTDVYLPLEKARYRIRIRGIIFENHEDLFIGLDAIYFEGNCFINKLPGISKKPRTDNSVVIVVSILAGILGLCLILIILKVRQMSRNEKSTQCGLPLFCASLRSDESLDTMSSFIGGNSVNSPLYTSIEEYEKVQSDIHSIARHKLTVQRLLGKGAFGEVYYGLLADVAHSEVPTPVAVKTLPTLCSDQTKLDFFMEAVMLSKLKHPNIVKFIGISIEGSSILLVTELMDGGDLRSYLRCLRTKLNDITTQELVLLCIDVATGCQYLEEHGCIHRDLATRNCLLSEKGSRKIVKVGDFGMSRLTGRTNYYRKKGTALVPVKWMSPEAFIDGVFTSKTDVWSYGVLLWEVFSLGHVPYPGKSNEEVMQFVKHGGRLPKPEICTEKIYQLMTNCWADDSRLRPNFTTIKEKLTSIEQCDNNSTSNPYLSVPC
ncbi:uncharacterized protein LOC143048607 isoform X2 [Mytilus galloprovincialis]|uniref:uncharacterized protein LOC143048607 isoform X2 n=1 Tax=Mytilus galloprovincialis TaxID=29158 RepID=UPI003F7C2862